MCRLVAEALETATPHHGQFPSLGSQCEGDLEQSLRQTVAKRSLIRNKLLLL